MSKIFVIAGPPGVGKSMNGEEFIDSEFDIINEDEMRFKYKEQGYPDVSAKTFHWNNRLKCYPIFYRFLAIVPGQGQKTP